MRNGQDLTDILQDKVRTRGGWIGWLVIPSLGSSEFRKYVLSWLRDNGIHIDTLKETDLIFGKFDSADDFVIINHMLLLGKFYIYSQ